MTPPAAAADNKAERHPVQPPTPPRAMARENSPERVDSPEPTPEPGPGNKPAPASPDARASGSEGKSVALAELATGNWYLLLGSLGLTGIVQNIASHCELRGNDGGALDFVLDEDHSTLFNDSHQDKLRLALENYFAEPVKVVITPGTVASETPAMRHTRLAGERQQQAIEAIESDPNLKALMARFDGELDRSSIVPMDA